VDNVKVIVAGPETPGCAVSEAVVPLPEVGPVNKFVGETD